MLDRFKENERLRLEALQGTRLVNGNPDLAFALDQAGALISVPQGQSFIDQGGEDNDLFLILAGVADIVVNGRTVAKRGAGSHVGEMAALQPSQRRSASCVAAEDMIVLKILEPRLAELGERFPNIYRTFAQELARRLLERNSTISAHRDTVRVFIISSAEALPIARMVQEAFERDPFLTTVWTDGVFKVTSYALASLEEQVEASDFAIAIAHADDLTDSRGKEWPSPRDNVVFELGLFMGRLGRARAILMEPREEQVKLPSDLAGITTITYRYERGEDASTLLAPACNKLRRHIEALGPYNG